MSFCRVWLAALCSLALLCATGCSREGQKPAARRGSPAPKKALIDSVYDAVLLQAAGGAGYRAPKGTRIESRRVIRTDQGKQVEYAEISGFERKGTSLAVIVFRFPAAWLTTERERLVGLSAEMTALTSCAQLLRTNELQGKAPGAKDSCRMAEITAADGMPGIAILDDRVSHIDMLLYRVK